MTPQYSFTSPTKTISGINARKKIGEEIKTFGGNVVFVCTEKSVVEEGLLIDILDSICKHNLAYIVFNEIDDKLTTSIIEEGVNIYRNEQCDVLLAVGGSTAIDAAKAIYTTINHSRDTVSEAFCPYIINIPTSIGIGAGVLSNSIMNNIVDSGKIITIPVMTSRVVVLDPVLLQSLPVDKTALAGMSTLSHAIEGYISMNCFEFTDLLNRKAIKLVARYLRLFIANRKNSEAAIAMHNAYLYSALGSINSGLGLVDAISKAIHVHFNISYELATAMTLPVVMEFNAIACPEKFSNIAALFGENIKDLPAHEAAFKAVYAVKKLARDIGIPDRIDNLNINDDQIGLVSKDVVNNSNVQLNNPRETSLEDIVNMCKKVFDVH